MPGVSVKFKGGLSPIFTRASPANRSPSPALLPLRSRCHWTSGAIRSFCSQFLRCFRVFSVPASRSFVSLYHALPVCACARFLSPPVFSDLCSERPNTACTDWELDTHSGSSLDGLPPICSCFPRRLRPCSSASLNPHEPPFFKTPYETTVRPLYGSFLSKSFPTSFSLP